MRMSMLTRVMALMLNVLLLASCSTLVSRNGERNAQSSSLMDFLYPELRHRSDVEHEKVLQIELMPEIPTLTLPVTVGLAFVPSENWHRDGIHSKDQIELLDKVKNSFLKYEYIDRIEVIPDAYLKGGKGFLTIEQVARLYDVDVMALVSYDQVSQSLENNAALLYWTIVGMYVIPGNENTVQTFVDTAVFDVKSKKMLFRAPGINKLTKRTTAIGIDNALLEKSLQSFDHAVADMTVNLEAELARFATRVKDEKVASINVREGYSGGGSFYAWIPIAMLFLLIRFFAGGREFANRT